MKGSTGPSTSYCFVRWRVLYSVLGGAVACKCRMFIDLNPVKLTDTCVVGYPVADACCIGYVTYVAPPNPYPIYSNFLYPIWGRSIGPVHSWFLYPRRRLFAFQSGRIHEVDRAILHIRAEIESSVETNWIFP